MSVRAGMSVRAARATPVYVGVLLSVAPMLLARPVTAQRLEPGAMPIGVEMRFDDDAYPVAGSTATEILAQLRALGPGSGWTRFPYRYTWRYRNERVPLTNGMPSDHCTSVDFTLIFDLTATYPRWIAPDDAPPALVEAWTVFSEQLVRHWAQIREDMVGRGREAATRLRRFEERCTFIDERIRERVIEAFSQPDPRRADEPRVRLRWPPEGYEHLMQAEPVQESRAPADGEPDLARPSSTSAGPGQTETARTRPSLPRSVVPASDIDGAVRIDTDRGRAIGLVVDLHHRGEPAFRESFGLSAADSDTPLESDAAFAFPAFTEVLIAMLATTLAADGTLDLKAPIRAYLPEESTGLAGTTLEQLLSHRAGLDNAMVPDTADWARVMERLDDRALFTDPGAVFSYSRYSYPLAGRVIESALGSSIEDAIERLILDPLGLTGTSLGARDAVEARDGLPATHTTVQDLARFWMSWLDGEIVGAGPGFLPLVEISPTDTDGRSFMRGYWYDVVGAAPRISLACGSSRTGDAAGFQVYPESRTIMSFWSRYEGDKPEDALAPPSASRWPRESVRFVLSRVAAALGLGDEVYRPTLLTGGGQAILSSNRCAEPFVSRSRVRDFGPVAPTDDWAGRYVNGEWFFVLLDRDGQLASPVDPSRAPYSVRHYGDEIYFTDMDLAEGPSVGFPLRLIRDDAGRRYVVLGDRAYLHEDDRR
jgi:CubicO group peptidase (beta-lactamase class C family)/predicted secreted Zn-dependent protease